VLAVELLVNLVALLDKPLGRLDHLTPRMQFHDSAPFKRGTSPPRLAQRVLVKLLILRRLTPSLLTRSSAVAGLLPPIAPVEERRDVHAIIVVHDILLSRPNKGQSTLLSPIDKSIP
jgi:hypothetical protein